MKFREYINENFEASDDIDTKNAVKDILSNNDDSINESIDPKLIKKIAKMTDNNDHTGARIEIADKILKNKKLADAYKGIDMISMFIGSLPYELDTFRTKILDSKYLKKSLEQKLSDEEFDSVWGAL